MALAAKVKQEVIGKIPAAKERRGVVRSSGCPSEPANPSASGALQGQRERFPFAARSVDNGGKRRRLLNYLKETEPERYKTLITSLESAARRGFATPRSSSML